MSNSTVASRVKDFRESLGMTQSEFSLALFMGKSYVNGLEKGIQLPNANFLMKLRKIYGVDLNVLLCGE